MEVSVNLSFMTLYTVVDCLLHVAVHARPDKPQTEELECTSDTRMREFMSSLDDSELQGGWDKDPGRPLGDINPQLLLPYQGVSDMEDVREFQGVDVSALLLFRGELLDGRTTRR